MNFSGRKVTLFVLFFCLARITFAQVAVIRGKVTADKTQEPLPYVNIGVKGENIGTFTDSAGIYQLKFQPGQYTLVFSSIGYDKLEKVITLTDKSTHIMDVTLKSSSKELNTVVVSASKYAQRIQESISSIEVLKPNLIQASNIQTVDKAVEQVPGVAVVDNEPQIRAGSGFSSGLGSRVMVMVDGMPILRGDAGRPVWSFLPINDIDQIEVVKGASSVLYGSSALNGVINVRTAWPGEEPMTNVTIFSGMYSKPKRKFDTPWTGSNPLQYGVSFSHSQKIENFDYCIGANYYNDQGYIGPVPEEAKLPDSVVNTGSFAQRVKFNFNTRIRSKSVEGLSFGINGNLMYEKSADTYFWYNADTNIYRPYPGAITNFKDYTFYVDPFINYYGKEGSVHTFKNRFFYDNSNATNNQSAFSSTLYDEYQYQKKFRKMENLVMVLGVMNSYVWSHGQVFSGVLSADSTTNTGAEGHFTSENFAVYAQFEKKFFHRLTVLIGGRWEYFNVAEYYDSKPVFRAGANLQVGRGTFFRASLGQGYRFPSIGERYITTGSGQYGFYPNPELKSETALNGEIGLKQVFKIANFVGFADVVGFMQDYENYVEFNFGLWGKSPDFTKNAGFKFFNTGPARIYGIDCTLVGEGEIVHNLGLNVLFGYTYSVPQAKDPDYQFYQSSNPHDYNTYRKSSSDTNGHILKYRIQSLLKANAELTYKKFSTGFSIRYYGFMKNIDKFFIDYDKATYFATGITKYREDNNTGITVYDCRFSYLLKDFKFSVIINNLLNKEYSLRPLTMESPRSTSIQIIYKI
jgi:outer membrane cobalamin receptor